MFVLSGQTIFERKLLGRHYTKKHLWPRSHTSWQRIVFNNRLCTMDVIIANMQSLSFFECRSACAFLVTSHENKNGLKGISYIWRHFSLSFTLRSPSLSVPGASMAKYAMQTRTSSMASSCLRRHCFRGNIDSNTIQASIRHTCMSLVRFRRTSAIETYRRVYFVGEPNEVEIGWAYWLRTIVYYIYRAPSI